MEKIDSWRLCDELSVIQAALLMVEVDPVEFADVMSWPEKKRPENFPATFTAITHAILGDRLPATLRHKAIARYLNKKVESGIILTKHVDIFSDQKELPKEACDPKHPEFIYHKMPSWDLSTVRVEDLKVWLKSRGVKQGFFFPQTTETQEYLDPNHKHYSPKLSAAIRSWQAVSADPELIVRKTVKQALIGWLRKNASQFGLIKGDGILNKHGIGEIAKISNWIPKGGVPKTPG